MKQSHIIKQGFKKSYRSILQMLPFMVLFSHLKENKRLPLFPEHLVKNNPEGCLIISCRHSSLGKILQCEDIYREGQHIGCSFALTNLKDSSFEQHSVQIVVKDNAGKIRPSFNIVPLTSHGKFSKSCMTVWIKGLRLLNSQCKE